jgi:DnaK suppressor protein
MTKPQKTSETKAEAPATTEPSRSKPSARSAPAKKATGHHPEHPGEATGAETSVAASRTHTSSSGQVDDHSKATKSKAADAKAGDTKAATDTPAKRAPAKKTAPPAKKAAATTKKAGTSHRAKADPVEGHPARATTETPAAAAEADTSSTDAAQRSTNTPANRSAKTALGGSSNTAASRSSNTAASGSSKTAASRSSNTAASRSAKTPAAELAAEAPERPSPEFLAEQRILLIEERAGYNRSANELQAQADSLALEHEPGDVQFDEEGGEGGTSNVDRELDLVLSAQALAAIEEIDRALAKIEAGNYGNCEQCGRLIPEDRLRALPYAALCVACKSGGLSRRS